MRSIGLDVGRESAEVAIVGVDGRTRSGGRIRTTPEGLTGFARTLGPDDRVVLEATTNTWAIVELLEAHAGEVIVSNPLRTRAIADAKTKTDTIDAATLAELLAADYLPAVWQPDAATRALRRRVAARAALVAERTRLRNRVSAILARNLVSCPLSDTFGKRGRAWLDDGDAARGRTRAGRCHAAPPRRPGGRDRVRPRLASPVSWPTMRRVRRLLTIPGIGPHTAAGLVALIGDVRRFSRPNKLGRLPRASIRSCASRVSASWTGHISRAGLGHARMLLVEAAHAAVRAPGPLRAFYVRVAARRGPCIAAVAVARKLAVLAWHLLTHETDYRWAPADLTEGKLRRVELAAGSPDRRGRARGDGGAAGRRRHTRAADRARLERAETEYVAFVAGRRRSDAAAATGERLSGRRPAAPRSPSPHSAVRLGVDRVRGEDTPMADPSGA